MPVRNRPILSASGHIALGLQVSDFPLPLGMIQSLLILLLFAAAVVYLGRMVYTAFTAKSCASGCGKCSTLDIDRIANQVRSRENFL